jgi:hypothetical protein
MEHTTPQPEESPAVFSHQPSGPIESTTGFDYFTSVAADIGVSVPKSRGGKLINLRTDIYTASQQASVTKQLTADKCEALAYALLNAVHHLRTITKGGAL